LAAAHIVIKPLWFIFLLYSARKLGPEGYGDYMYAISFISIIAAVFEGGVDIATLRELSSRPAAVSTLAAHTSILKILSGLVVGGIAVLLSSLLDVAPLVKHLILFSIVYSLCNSLMIHYRHIFRAFEVLKLEAQSIVTEKLSVVVVAGVFLFFSADVSLFTLSFSLAYCLALCFTISLLKRHFGSFQWKFDLRYMWAFVLRPALPYALMNFFMIVYFRSGTIMLERITGRSEIVGYYNAGYRLVESFILFPSIIVTPLYPTFTRFAQDKAKIAAVLANASRFVCLVSVVISFPIFLFKEDFTRLFFGAQYASASIAVGVIGLAMIPVGFTWVFGSLVAAIGRQPRANWYIAFVTCLNLLLHYLLIPRMGLLGASLSTLVTETSMALCCIWVVRDYGFVAGLKKFAFLVILPLMVILILKELGFYPQSFVVGLVVTLSIITLSFFALRLVTVAEVKKFIMNR
jgi:O-antigen/teichoic acid export membrane protein